MKWIFNWYVLTFLAVVLIGVLVWFVGPLIAIAGAEPLSGEIVRIATITVIFLIWLALAVWRIVRARRANAALQQGLAQTAEADKESAVLAKRMLEALGTMKRMGGRAGRGNYLYSRPWYINLRG